MSCLDHREVTREVTREKWRRRHAGQGLLRSHCTRLGIGLGVDGSGLPGYTSLVAIEAVLEQALRLSANERAKLIELLLDSLDETDDPGHDAAWAEVIDRRMQDIREGRVELVDAADAMAQARAAATARR